MAAIKQEALQALSQMPVLGLGVLMPKKDPHSLMVELINRSAGLIEWYELKFQTMDSADELTQTSGETGYGPSIPSVWMKLYNDERDRCARYCKQAVDMGVAERAVRIAEQQGMLIAKVIQMLLDGLNLTPEQQEQTPNLVRNVLMQMPALEAQLVEIK